MNVLPNSNKSRRAAALSDGVIAEVAGIFSVLGEPTRLRMVEQLREGPLCVSDLVERLGAKQANVSKQLGILHGAGLVARERDGAQVRYYISEPLVLELCDAVCAKLKRDAEATVASLRGVRVRR
ncbi:MAG TPA: metalloregulator ArsR/SmtB family transcription factor [Polyangiaceae bacterium]|jgi:DNA-binding transcriptional ArsR family regulator